MKKILSVLLLISVLLSSLSFTAFAAEETVITTSDANLCKLTSNWFESTNPVVAGPTGGSSWYTTDASATATYDASGLAKGNYGVYVFVTPWGDSTSKRVNFTVTASGKSTTVETNGEDGGKGNRHWVFIGKYDFTGAAGEGVVQKMADGEKSCIVK